MELFLTWVVGGGKVKNLKSLRELYCTVRVRRRVNLACTHWRSTGCIAHLTAILGTYLFPSISTLQTSFHARKPRYVLLTSSVHALLSSEFPFYPTETFCGLASLPLHFWFGPIPRPPSPPFQSAFRRTDLGASQ